MHVFIYILFRDERIEILIPLQLRDRTKLENKQPPMKFSMGAV